MSVTLIFRILCVVVCVLFAIYRRISRLKNEPPALSGYLPLIGHLHLVLGGSNGILNVIKRGTEEGFKKRTPLSFWMGPKLMYVLTDPDDCLLVANTCFQTTYTFANEVFGNGLLTCPASVWKGRRKLINPAFNQQVLDEFVPIFNRQSRRLVDAFRTKVGKGFFDNLPYVRENTLQTICLTAMGLDVSEVTSTNLHYLEAFDRILAVFVERLMNPLLHIEFVYAHSKLKRKQQTYLKAFHEMSAMVLERKKKQMKITLKSNTESKPKAFIDFLLEEGIYSDNEIKEEVDTFMAAGHETIATLLVFVLVLIGSFTKVQERIVEEFKQIFKQRDKGEDLTRRDLSRLHYLEAVIKETLRYYCLVPFVIRELDRDIELKNTTLRCGRPCMLLLYALHRHPMWGEDSHMFKPERWLDSTTLPHHPAAFAGFSIGKRNCIGQNFAMLSLKTLIVHLLRCYRVTSDHNNLQMKVDFVFRAAGGHYISLQHREGIY